MFVWDDNLHKQWNGIQFSDEGSICFISGQDMQCSCATFHNLLHSHTILREGKRRDVVKEDLETETAGFETRINKSWVTQAKSKVTGLLYAYGYMHTTNIEFNKSLTLLQCHFLRVWLNES